MRHGRNHVNEEEGGIVAYPRDRGIKKSDLMISQKGFA